MDFETMEMMHQKWVNETNSNETKLKNIKYQNQKYMPIIQPKNKKETVLEKLPPGGLHVLLLGAGNDIYDCIEENLPSNLKHVLFDFEKYIGGKRPSYNGKAWEGNQIHKILKEKSFKKLEELLPKELHCCIEGFKMLEELNSTMTRSKMLNEKCKTKEDYVKECEDKVDSFMEVFDYMKFNFGTSKTVKIHTIESHLVDYVKLTSKTLSSLDQAIESVHQYFHQRLMSSHYKSNFISNKWIVTLCTAI